MEQLQEFPNFNNESDFYDTAQFVPRSYQEQSISLETNSYVASAFEEFNIRPKSAFLPLGLLIVAVLGMPLLLLHSQQ